MNESQRNEIALLILSGTRANNATPEHTIELLESLTALYTENAELRARLTLAESQVDRLLERAEREAADAGPFTEEEVSDDEPS